MVSPPVRVLGVTAIALSVACGATGCSTISGLWNTAEEAPPPAAAPAPAPGVVATDPASRASARLAGPSKLKNGKTDSGGALREYTTTLEHGAVQTLAVGELKSPPKGDPAAYVKQLATGNKGTLTKNQPVTVNGHPGADFRMDLAPGGSKGFMLGRVVFTPTGLIQVITTGPAAAESTDAPLHDQAAHSLQIP